jgi:large subunit ribosomal protein L15
VDTKALSNAGLINDPHVKVKLINKGPINRKVTVKLQAASKNAVAAVEKAGGSFEATEQLKRPATKKSK